MRSASPEFTEKSKAAQNRPVEIVDFFLGNQKSPDSKTLHFAVHDTPVDFYDTDGSQETYTPMRIERERVSHNMELRRNSLKLKIGVAGYKEVDGQKVREFQDIFWKHAQYMLDKRLVIRQIFSDLTDSPNHFVTIMDGLVDQASISEAACGLTIVSFLGYIGFKSGVAVDRVCPISAFASPRCSQGVDPLLLTQEATDSVDAGSTATRVKVKSIGSVDDYWKPGQLSYIYDDEEYVRKVIGWEQSTKTIILDFPLPEIPLEDETVTVKRDCDRTLKMCRERFTEVNLSDGNSDNFRGYNTAPNTVNP